ncbi:DUF2309 domain-containing protein [Stratiformator vulcanicus]|uniref:Probable inorganic carbon transporter subunit DabA n=1 Tax=Stratiformator vulcanicus TaxID=2527980 RepID=A0A517R3B0_9PLAN|nr:DUF2309 domain-containing protein [Stratiformator vulcanicus]QDT38369.1 hypothetical protein Pan189_27620 [Stratiformator vulcanicus]
MNGKPIRTVLRHARGPAWNANLLTFNQRLGHAVPTAELEDDPTSLNDHAAESLRHMVEHAAHLLPAQGPIEVFVHHNTLHAFEEQSFHEAVKSGLARYGAAPYFTEQEYRQLYAEGRITDSDLEAVIKDDLGERAGEQINGLGTRCEIRYAMLRHPLHIGPDAELRWVVAETDALQRFRERTTQINRSRIVSAAKKWLQDSAGRPEATDDQNGLLKKFGPNIDNWSDSAWEAFSLHLLWRTCLNGVSSITPASLPPTYDRPRDLLLHATGEDIDRHVHEVLIRFCAAYVDQGYSDWLLPNRDQGFFESFGSLYSESSRGLDRWLKRLPDELSFLRNSNATAEASIEVSLRELGIAESGREEFIAQSLLALGGWAGMIWQLESGVDWVVHSIPKGSLVGMLAVQLILEKHAIRKIGAGEFGEYESLATIVESAQKRLSDPAPLNRERGAFLLFQVAQMLGWTPLELQQLSEAEWKQLSEEVEVFDGIERHRIFHEAYERKYHHAAINAFSKHAARRREIELPWGDRPDFQIVTCIDDREESFRRHLEEVQPRCETFGAAGFFAVAIYYRGAADGFYKPLCPGVITPDHYVQEDVGYTFEGVHQGRAELRRRLGLAGHLFHTRSRTFLGGIFAGIVGSLATVPLVARVLFPHLTARIRRRFGSLLQPPPVTQLQLERHAEPPGPTNGHIGYSIDEMADVVIRLLQDIGLTKSEDFSRLFIVCGHGSSSLNNPHESAYCCGACAGKRGGPNARAFAEMANDWRVRALVAQQGITIPNDTTFVGAYHNTCDDSVVFYDLDQLPSSHREDFESARDAIEEARRRNAHERCRRFVSAPLNITPKDALRHVEGRAQDISQARPEYNHATNALCVVGRRDWSRGLFLDRRAFLTSYDPTQDDEEHSILLRILSAAIPVCAGINLEYYFSCVDYKNYGSGSKLPHNIVSLLGVMEGTSSDLRTGLYQQMVEIHEPIRILFLIETTPEAMLSIMERNEGIARLCQGGWSHLAVIDAETSQVQVFRNGKFEPFDKSDGELRQVSSSLECYEGERDHRPFFSIEETEVSS